MFDISFAELLLIAVLAVIFIGPKEFPVVAKALARLYYRIKNLWNEIRGAVDDIAQESGIQEVKQEIENEVGATTRMIQGDDGKWYEAYDLDEINSKNTMQPLAEVKEEQDGSPYDFPIKKDGEHG